MKSKYLDWLMLAVVIWITVSGNYNTYVDSIRIAVQPYVCRVFPISIILFPVIYIFLTFLYVFLSSRERYSLKSVTKKSFLFMLHHAFGSNFPRTIISFVMLTIALLQFTCLFPVAAR